MNPRLKRGGLSLPLRADLTASRSTTERDKRHHDRCPRYVYRGIAISVITMPTRLTNEGSLTLTVLFCTVSTHATRPRRVARVNQVQWDTGQSGFIREEETQLRKGPGGMASTLRVSNRAFRPLTDVP